MFRDQVVMFQWKGAFHAHFLARAWYCSNHPMRRSRPQEISIFEKANWHMGDYVGKKLAANHLQKLVNNDKYNT